MDIKISLFFISTFFLIFGGFIAIIPILPKFNHDLKKKVHQVKFQLRMGVYGIISILLFAFFPFNDTIILGDLLPMISSFILTSLFLMGYIRESNLIDEKTAHQADQILTSIQIPAGFLSFAIGFLHIIFPKLILL